MTTKVHRLPFNAQFEQLLHALCLQEAVSNRRLVTSFVAPGTAEMILVFQS